LLHLEELETRALLSASAVTAAAGNWSAQPNLALTPQASGATGGYSPQQLQQAYGLTSLLSSGTNGQGETIAVVDAYHDPNIQQDLQTFDQRYGLPTANLTVVNQTGSTTNLPAVDTSGGWEVEESLDVEWAHAIAPGAKLVLVEANSASLSDLMQAVKTASTTMGANVVSMSWGGSEFASQTSYDANFKTPGVTYVASAGDNSAYAGPQWPASSPNVLAVGGTTLHLTPSNTIAGETAWNYNYSWYYGLTGGGGGVSAYENAPDYQSSNIGNYGGRTTPDVSWVANPSTGVAVYDSYHEPGWGAIGGTSAGAPAWAGIVVLADQAAHTSLGTGQVNSALYGVYHNNPTATTYTSSFHDITSGNNGYSAGVGYDLATGLGTPNAAGIVAVLTSSVGATPPVPASGGAGSGSSPAPAPSSGGAGGGPTKPPVTAPTKPPVNTLGTHPHTTPATDNSATTSASAPSATLVISLTVTPVSSSSAAAVPVQASVSTLVFALGGSTPGVLGSSLTALAGAGDALAARDTVLFGASGWSSSFGSWRLSSLSALTLRDSSDERFGMPGDEEDSQQEPAPSLEAAGEDNGEAEADSGEADGGGGEE
jgi:hypothetical protein